MGVERAGVGNSVTEKAITRFGKAIYMIVEIGREVGRVFAELDVERGGDWGY